MREIRLERLTDENIKKDLLLYEKKRISRLEDWRMSYIVPLLTAAVVLWFLLKLWWLSLGLTVIPIYQIVCLVSHYREYGERKRQILGGGYTVQTDRLNAIVEDEPIHEPWTGRHGSYSVKHVDLFHFSSSEWRVVPTFKHYAWSGLYAMSQQGLFNTSIPGDEFYTVVIGNDSEIAYVYNKKLFDYQPEKKEGARGEGV